ncbi:MAG: hypothetical protein JSW09_09570 [Pseudomonadota bacterium]|nr:MAG: hypothetical protein JSW09_09570 [Pseudomonadota bacterium]
MCSGFARSWVGMPALIMAGLMVGCAPSQPTDKAGVEATNAGAKQAWQKPRDPATVEQLRNRMSMQEDS